MAIKNRVAKLEARRAQSAQQIICSVDFETRADFLAAVDAQRRAYPDGDIIAIEIVYGEESGGAPD
jgi:hypothetical protein